MLEIRWHSRAGQGAVTGAKVLVLLLQNLVNKFKLLHFMVQLKEVRQ